MIKVRVSVTDDVRAFTGQNGKTHEFQGVYIYMPGSRHSERIEIYGRSPVPPGDYEAQIKLGTDQGRLKAELVLSGAKPLAAA